jgi:hypothetical protein
MKPLFTGWLSQAKLRSTTQRHRLFPLPCSVLRFARKRDDMRGTQTLADCLGPDGPEPRF